MQEKVAIKCIIRGLSQANGLFTWLTLIRRESTHCRRGPLDWSLRACEFDAVRDKRTDEFHNYTTYLIKSSYLDVIEEIRNFRPGASK